MDTIAFPWIIYLLTVKENGQFVMVSTTTESGEDAEKLARTLVDERLVACVQSIPISSVYRWKGEVESASEILLLAKTRQALADRVVARIKENHSYEVPEIVVTPISGGHQDYLNWITAETKDDD